MVSLCANWSDESYKKALLFLTLEEATFYEPQLDIEIRCFVVATLRNSMLEHCHGISSEYKEWSYPKSLSSNQIRYITEEAIKFFKAVDFSKYSGRTLDNDYYRSITAKYPMAWTAIMQLANNEYLCKNYTKVPNNNSVKDEIQAFDSDASIDKMNKVILSGYDEILDDTLKSIIKSLLEDKMDFFYVDCFKMLSRNFEKLLKVIEYVLFTEKPFVTINYYIDNGYFERRNTILRANHGFSPEVYKAKLKNKEEVQKNHSICLGHIYNSIES